MKDMNTLANELAQANDIAKEEEQYYADENFNLLKTLHEHEKNSLPFPEVRSYDTGHSYDEIDDLNYQKTRNKPHWVKMDLYDDYIDSKRLYVGHLQYSGSNVFITEGNGLPSNKFVFDGAEFNLINVDDGKHQDIFRMWKFPNDKNSESVTLSRAITLDKNKVTKVDVILDKTIGSTLHEKITDLYLRNSLLKNKDGKLHSIISTIQKKQDDIRIFPVEKSFILQGCAGSGKTVVLLNRLRYLAYNKMIRDNTYIVLVPSQDFFNYIRSNFKEFRISESCVKQFTQYYKWLLNSNLTGVPEYGELVFGSDFLSRIYSREFIQECYAELFELISTSLDELISLSDDFLNRCIRTREQEIEDKRHSLNQKFMTEATALISPFEGSLCTKLNGLYDISLLLEELSNAIEFARKEAELVDADYLNLEVADDDSRLQNDPRIIRARKKMDTERIMLNKASVFTRRNHLKKLKYLESDFEEMLKQVKIELLEAEKKKMKISVFPGIDIETAEKILEELQKNKQDTEIRFNKIDVALKKVSQEVESTHKHYIDKLNKLMDQFEAYGKNEKVFIEELKPANIYFKNLIRHYRDIWRWVLTSDDETIIHRAESLKIFDKNTDEKTEAYINLRLDNIIKRKIREEFGHTISQNYKHYWYLKLYARYLTRNISKDKAKSNIFIDEGQDLSSAEVELIKKVNEYRNPIFNIFGDDRQAISPHNINDWRKVDFIDSIYTLDENFRNTTEIVEYCNSTFDFKMKEVGVSISPIKEFNSIEEVDLQSFETESIAVILKDEYYKADFQKYLENKRINLPNIIYTVSDAKGLEFKEVLVIDQRMTVREKYVAYTRALAHLTIIHSIPELSDHSKSRIIEGYEEINDEIDL